MNSEEIKEALDSVEEAKKQMKATLNEFNSTVSKLDIDTRKEVNEPLRDLSKITKMFNSGDIDEKFVNELKLKYANKNN